MLSDSDIRDRLGPIHDPLQDPHRTPPSKRSVGLIAAVVIVVLLWGGAASLILHLEKISPAKYEPQTGHIYRFTDTRHIVYLTTKERYAAYTALAIPALVTLAVIFYALGRNPDPELG
jgi:hypothetical protein